jgi:hypothetical protein
MREGRQAKSSFDVKSYKNKYQDLRIAYGNSLPKYYEHYLKWGSKEKRTATGVNSVQNPVTVLNGVDYSKVYNYRYYINKYADVRRAFGNDDVAVLKHFVNNGMREGRQAKDTFNQKAYKNRYEDLSKAYGNNNKAYYLHYIKWGYKEGRIATPIDYDAYNKEAEKAFYQYLSDISGQVDVSGVKLSDRMEYYGSKYEEHQKIDYMRFAIDDFNSDGYEELMIYASYWWNDGGNSLLCGGEGAKFYKYNQSKKKVEEFIYIGGVDGISEDATFYNNGIIKIWGNCYSSVNGDLVSSICDVLGFDKKEVQNSSYKNQIIIYPENNQYKILISNGWGAGEWKKINYQQYVRLMNYLTGSGVNGVIQYSFTDDNMSIFR